ncbi:MAG: GNAT family N-acetyltransferase [Anaerolineae bacterium]|nr:GNAT family N-acetyltransferase [Anaerolineae bacterium]
MSKVRMRPAQAVDRPIVEALCARAWEGEDYVPDVWDEWLADPHGQLVVAELESRVVGLAKLSRLADDEWWLEGLRVDPAHRRQGIACQLQAHLVEKARHVGHGTLRSGTHSLNDPVHRIAAHDGFRHIATYRFYRADPLPATLPHSHTPTPVLLAEGDLLSAWALVSASPRYRAAGGLYETFWKWENLTRERLACHLAAGDVWGVYPGHELAALALVCRAKEEDALDVGYVDGAEKPLVVLLRGLRRLAAQLGHTEVRFKSVEEPALVAVVEAAGYERSWDRDIWIFELQLRLLLDGPAKLTEILD